MNCAFLIAAAFFAFTAFSAPVKIVALDYVSGRALAGIELEWIENGSSYTTDDEGVVMLDAPVGSNMTVNFAGNSDYHQVESVTVRVPEEGLTTLYDQLVMQVPSNLMYDIFFLVIPGKKNESRCQAVVTVCDVNKTVYSHPQGLPGTVAVLAPALQSKTFYFGTWGKLSNETNPLPNNLTSTSFDGGVLFEDLPVDPDQWYTVSAYHEGYTFSTSTFRCTRPGMFVNGAPNQGPRATPLE